MSPFFWPFLGSWGETTHVTFPRWGFSIAPKKTTYFTGANNIFFLNFDLRSRLPWMACMHILNSLYYCDYSRVQNRFLGIYPKIQILNKCSPWTHGDFSKFRVHLYAYSILFGLETIYEDDIMFFLPLVISYRVSHIIFRGVNRGGYWGHSPPP